MPTDVIIDPANGQIYWNDGTGSPQSIAIGGNALDTISVSGYSAAYSPGSTPAASAAGTLVKFTDAAQATLTPGTNAYELGSGSLRWKFFGTTTNISDNSAALGTNTFSLTTGLVQINGGIAISGNAGVAQTLFHYNPNDPRYYVGFRSSASLASTQTYTFPLTYPSTGSSILQSDTAGTLTWVPMTAASASASTALNINIVSATTGTFFPLFTNTSTTANGISGVAVSVDSMFSFDAASNVLIVDGATMGGLGLTTTFASFDIGNTAAIAQTLNFSNTTTGQVQFNFGTASASASTATFFGPVNSNRMILNVNSSGNVYLQTNQVNARVRLFQNNTTGNVSIFGTGGGTLYLGEDSTTNNADIALRGTVLNGGGGNVRAAVFSISTATSNGSGVGGTIQFQTSTSGNPTGNLPNALRTRLRIEGAATGTSSLESIIIFGDATSGTAWSSFLRGVDATGTDIEAGEIQIQAGRSTGTGAARGISFYVSPSSTTSATLNAASQIARFSATGLTVYSTTPSTSTVTGALIVAGGAGIGGSLYTATANASSISGVVHLNSVITSGAWAATAITTAYGGHGAIPAVSKGDILVGAGNTWYNFPYSASNDQVLTVDTTLPFGLKWATPSASASSVSVAASAGSTVLFLTSTNNSTGGGLALSTVTTLSYNTVANTLSSTGVTATYVRALQYLIPIGGNNIAWYASDGTTQLMGINTSNGWLRSYQTTNATSTTSASLVSSGGLSVATNAMIGGTATIFSTTSATGISSGAFNVVGGASINGNAFIGGTTNITSTSASGTTASGALVVTGGVGIGGSVNIGKSLNLWNPAYTFSTNLASGAATSTITYILPPGPPNGLGTSILSSSNTGILSWIPQSSGSSSGIADSVKVYGLGAQTYYLTMAPSFSGAATSLFSDANFAFESTSSTLLLGYTLKMSSGTAISNQTFNSPAGYTFTPSVDSSSSFVINNTAGFALFAFDASTGSTNLRINRSGVLRLYAPANNFYTGLQGGVATSNITYLLPPGPPNGLGTSILSSSNTGVMSWIPQSTGGSGTPGGSNKQIQYNNSSTFGGASGFEYTTGGIGNTVSIFSTTGTGYTAGFWVSAIGGTTRVGIGLSNPQFELEILGEISATNKSFVINHPTKPNMKLRYGSLEGPENGVYVRGILIGNNIIETPDYWVGLVDPDTFTVDLTPIGNFAQLYVQKIEDYKVYVGNSSAFNIHCFYTVWAERKDIPKLVTEY